MRKGSRYLLNSKLFATFVLSIPLLTMKYDIFISYSRKDIEIAKKLCAVLDEFKKYYAFKYFFDTSEIKSYEEYLERISQAISESKTLLFLASQNSYDSKFCVKELLFADNRDIHIHKYCIDDAATPMSLEMLLGTHQYRELKSISMESEVQEVLADSLGCEILSIEELKERQRQEDIEKKKQKAVYKKELCDSIKMLENRCFDIRRDILAYEQKILALRKEEEEIEKRIDDLHSKLDLEEAREEAQSINLRRRVKDRRYKEGDYYDDGVNQGVVFAVSDGGKHGKIVSLDETTLPWCTGSQYANKVKVGALSDVDGKLNTDAVMQREDFEEYPAFVWCREKGDDWYLPSTQELFSLYLLKDKVNKTLKNRSKCTISGYYRSSTEIDECSAQVVSMNGGSTYNYSKNFDDDIRAVALF